MKYLFALLPISLFLISCADESQKPKGPVSESSKIPWNTPVAGQGGGQFGALPQNQFRR